MPNASLNLAQGKSRVATDEVGGVFRDAGMDIDLTETISELEGEMLDGANNLEFEKTALLRDQMRELKRTIDGSGALKPAKPVSYRRGGRRRVRM